MYIVTKFQAGAIPTMSTTRVMHCQVHVICKISVTISLLKIITTYLMIVRVCVCMNCYILFFLYICRVFWDDKCYAVVDTSNGTKAMNKLFKYKFTPKRKSLTLSTLVTQLSDRFLPDLYRNYVLQNLHHCIGHTTVLCQTTYMEGLILWFCTVWRENSGRINMIRMTSFQLIRGEYSKLRKRKFSSTYTLLICTCKDWTHWNIPCKLFL